MEYQGKGTMFGEITSLLQKVYTEQRVTNKFLLAILKQEMTMAATFADALKDFDAEIAAIAQDISDLATRIAGGDATAAAALEDKLAALKAAADPLKQLDQPAPPAV